MTFLDFQGKVATVYR